MKKILIVAIFSASSLAYSQERTTDLFQAKAGFIGAWLGYEKALSPKITLGLEIGYEGGLYYNSLMDDDVNYIFTTTLSMEGRYYYNFKKRVEKGKNTANNAANFIALETTYTPDWGTSSTSDHIDVLRTFSIIPKYGFKRSISKKFNFEFAIGPGYQWVEDGENGVIIGLDAKFGFKF